jgi:hypothetical protein
LPTTALVDGVPLIFGAVLLVDVVVEVVTVSEKPSSDRDAVPSLTRILMLGNTPTLLFVGVPESTPVLELNESQPGLLAIENLSVSPSASFAVGLK